MPESGSVFLVGAGPGDPGLLTLRAAELLGRADALLYDALAADPIVALAPPSCERIFVGKRGGNHAMEQREIEALMVRLARRGMNVVRLKGGDPFVFGRGGEEAQAMARAGIPFEIVPGISSAIAAPAYAGIPVTHRAYNAAFTVATAHEDPSKGTPALDWQKLADPRSTLVLLMGAGNLREAMQQLIAHGLSAATPAAIVQNGTRPQQRTVAGTLETIAEDAARIGIGSPAVVIVGGVVRLRDEIAWFEANPLFGKRVLVTRAGHQSQAFARALSALGAEPVVAPAIALGPPDDPLPADRAVDGIAAYAWVVFTSQNGVDAFFQRLARLGADARFLGTTKVAAIGTRTAQRLQEHGIRADLIPARYVSEEIAPVLIRAARQGDRILIYRAQEARDVLPRMLSEAGLRPDVVAAYKTSFTDDPDFAAKVARADVLTFTSASTVCGFVHLLGGAAAAQAAARGKLVACIGPVTAQAARDAGLEPGVVADVYTTDGLLRALVDRVAPSV
jgi:uroporphyrinogen III methyltransferase/synthase